MTDRRFLDAHMRQSYARAEAVGNLLVRAGRAYGWDSDAFVETAVDAVLAGQTAQASATWEALSAIVTAADPLERELDVEPPVDVMIGAATHDGTPLETVYRRPGSMLTSLAAEGLADAVISSRIESEVFLMADADIFSASRKSEQVYGAVDRRVVGWRRVPNVGACKWCRYIATQRYKKQDLAPAHRGCHCGTEPIVGARDPGQILDPEGLARIKREGVPTRHGSRQASARRANQRIENPRIPEPPPVVETPAFRTGPVEGTRSPSSVVQYESKRAETFATYLDQLDEIHGVADDGFAATTVRHGGKATRKGGHFGPEGSKVRRPARKKGESIEDYRARWREAQAKRSGPEILILDRGDGTEAVSFLHEFGHRIDWDPRIRDYVTGRASHGSEEVTAAVGNFLKTATSNDHFAEARRTALRSGVGYAQYFTDPREVWARAYSQWAATKLGGAADEALSASLSKSAYMQWPRELFDAEIAPTVEAVLRARGLMQ